MFVLRRLCRQPCFIQQKQIPPSCPDERSFVFERLLTIGCRLIPDWICISVLLPTHTLRSRLGYENCFRANRNRPTLFFFYEWEKCEYKKKKTKKASNNRSPVLIDCIQLNAFDRRLSKSEIIAFSTVRIKVDDVCAKNQIIRVFAHHLQITFHHRFDTKLVRCLINNVLIQHSLYEKQYFNKQNGFNLK